MHPIVGALLALAMISTPAQQARVQFGSACVTVAAEDISLRELVAEWARLGQATLTGLESLPERTVTLHVDCADERKTLDGLLEGADRLLAPRDIETSGASKFSAIVILSRDSASPRRIPVSNTIPEIAYPDPVPGRDWAAVAPDLDGPLPVVIQQVTPGTIALSERVPEATFEYARPPHGDFGPHLPADADRDQKSLRKLIEAIQGGAVPESLFEYTLPVRKATPPDKKREP